MKIIQSVTSAKKLFCSCHQQGKKIGFVPTMGYFHEGHSSLMRRARKENDIVVVSIFVNPTQFGPGEDFKKYPRDRRTDVSLAKKEGVDYVFCPTVKDMYPSGFSNSITNERMSHVLCGASRPGHFQGVLTIVCKLFNILTPDRAYFGQKDFQQYMLIRQMVKDLNMGVRITMCPIVRERDKLAMSSRNVYLDKASRLRAVALSKSLFLARQMIQQGERNPKCIRQKINKMLKNAVDKIDYIAICAADSLISVNCLKGKIFIGIAAYIGKTRLIDNILVNVK